MEDARPLSSLKGVGEVLRRELARIGLETVGDLLRYFPRRYDDFSSVKPIASLRPGLVSVRARVEHISVRSSYQRRRLNITEVIVVDDTGSLKLTWFNAPFIAQQLREGEEYFFVGELKFASNSFGIVQPAYEKVLITGDANQQNIGKTVEPKLAGRIIAIYPETAKLSSKLLRNLVAQCLPSVDDYSDELPDSVVAKHELLTRSQAVRQLHQPDSMAALAAAQRRMGFAELFTHIITSLVMKHDLQTEPGQPMPFDETLAQQFVKQLPFKLTDGQRKVAWQIFHDLEKEQPMNRLLEGDVGSGKTVIAAFVALMAIQAGYQVAIMVPTEVLAQQHLRSFTELLEPWKIVPRLLTSRSPAKLRAETRQAVADGSLELIIGTQALITKGLEFERLGLVVVDEQHRFGVNQRIALKGKAGRLPHVLTMTATPIPRSLALAVYGDLDISILRELPPGRRPVHTKVIKDAERSKIYAHIDELIKSGQQAYIVCPSIDAQDVTGLKTVTAEYQRLTRTVFKHRRIGLLHGRLKSDEKAELMRQFASGELDILIATTVIEVGVHADNASVMMVEDADRFGLATLHQLRGRVGRSTQQGYCYLIASNEGEVALKRLRAMERTHDGFRLAQIDLETRGAGERFGTRQSGALDLRFTDFTDAELIAEARQAAEAFLNEENIVEYPQTLERVNQLKTVTSLD